MPVTAYEVPDLPYAYDALAPHIDAETMRLHHDEHHEGYARVLNETLSDYPDLATLSIEELIRNLDRIPRGIRETVRDYGGGCANHQLFWKIMAPPADASTEPTGELAAAIDETYGGLDSFEREFERTARDVFGSGWVFFTEDTEGTLRIETTTNQNNPLSEGRGALFALDCWEHAYYLSYGPRREEYVEAWWNVLDWATADERYERIPQGVAKFRREIP